MVLISRLIIKPIELTVLIMVRGSILIRFGGVRLVKELNFLGERVLGSLVGVGKVGSGSLDLSHFRYIRPYCDKSTYP